MKMERERKEKEKAGPEVAQREWRRKSMERMAVPLEEQKEAGEIELS